MIVAPDYAWALSTTALDSRTAQTLLVMARQLFPHDRLGDQYYATVVEAASDAALRKLLTDGVARLDAARGIAWVQLSNGARSNRARSEAWSDVGMARRQWSGNHIAIAGIREHAAFDHGLGELLDEQWHSVGAR